MPYETPKIVVDVQDEDVSRLYDRLPHFYGLIYNNPLMIVESKLDVIEQVLLKAGSDRNAFNAVSVATKRSAPSSVSVSRDEGEYLAMIPVQGTLMHKTSGLDAFSGLQSYKGIQDSFDAAMADPKAAAVVLNLNSPGGMVNGVFDLADHIYNARGDKPIYALVDEEANSAAYAIASAADSIYVTRTAMVGSIGVVTKRVDVTALNEKMGIKVETIRYGDKKSMGDPTVAMTSGERAEIQDKIDSIGEMFVAMVSRNRGMSARQVKGTQAAVYVGQTGVDAGLADAVASVDDALRDIATNLQTQRSNSMTVKTNANGAGTEVTASVPAPIPGPAVDLEAIKKTAHDEGYKAGMTAQKERYAATLALEETEGREQLCKHLLATTDMSAEDIKAALSAAAVEAPAVVARVNSLEANMQNEPNPDVDADGMSTANGMSDDDKAVASILASANEQGLTLVK